MKEGSGSGGGGTHRGHEPCITTLEPRCHTADLLSYFLISLRKNLARLSLHDTTSPKVRLNGCRTSFGQVWKKLKNKVLNIHITVRGTGVTILAGSSSGPLPDRNVIPFNVHLFTNTKAFSSR